MIVKLPDSFLIETKSITSCFRQFAPGEDDPHRVVMQYGDGLAYEWQCATETKANEIFSTIENTISNAINLKTTPEGAFICAHCGAPNSNV